MRIRPLAAQAQLPCPVKSKKPSWISEGNSFRFPKRWQLFRLIDWRWKNSSNRNFTECWDMEKAPLCLPIYQSKTLLITQVENFIN